MKIRASVLTPVVAVFAVVILVGAGIALGQARQGDAGATALDSTPASGATATTNATAVPAGQSATTVKPPTPPVAPSASEDSEDSEDSGHEAESYDD